MFGSNKNYCVDLLPSVDELFNIIKEKFSSVELTDFYKKYLIPEINFYKPKMEKLKLSATLTFNSKNNKLPFEEKKLYVENMYGIARFLNDFQLRRLGASNILPEESESDEDKKNIFWEVGSPEILFEISLYKGTGGIDDLLQIKTEYFVQYMNHSMDYSDKYNHNNKHLSKSEVWSFINQTTDKFINNIKEYHQQFERGYNEQGSLLNYYIDILQKYIKNGNQYKNIGQISSYTETIKLLGLTDTQVKDASGMGEMGFTD